MEKAEFTLRRLIRESLLESSSLNLVPHSEVVAAIDNAIRPDRLNITIPGFRELMINTAIVESGMSAGGKLFHNNKREGSIQGVFQLSPIALEQLRSGRSASGVRDRFDSSSAAVNTWAQQSDSEIFGNLKLQAIAACMYFLWLCEKYNKKTGSYPSLSTVGNQSTFWKTYYNTANDPNATELTYQNRVKDLGALA